MDMIIFAIVALVIGAVWWYTDKAKKIAEQQQIERNTLRLKQCIEEIRKSPAEGGVLRMGTTGPIDRGVVLNANEQLIVDLPVYMVRTVKTGNQWKSGSKGVRVTPVKGLSFNLGGTKGKMEASLERQRDEGNITLTTKRILFTGAEHSFSVPVDKVENVTRDGLTVFFDATTRSAPDFHIVFFQDWCADLFLAYYSNPRAVASLSFPE